MKKLILLALLSTGLSAGVKREVCTTDKRDPVTNKDGVIETITTITCQSKSFTDKDIADAAKKVKKMKANNDKKALPDAAVLGKNKKP